MPLVLKHAAKEDIPVMVEVASQTFGPNDFVNMALFPTAVREAPEWDHDDKRWRIQQAEDDISKPWIHFIKVIDTDNGDNIVGMARWDVPDEMNPDNDRPEEEKRRELEEKMKTWPVNLNREDFVKMIGIFEDMV
jgi:hypothetical protein